MPLSPRYLWGLLALLLAASVPVWWSAAASRRWEGCRDPDALIDARPIPGSLPDMKRRELQPPFFAYESGRIDRPGSGRMTLGYRILRSDDAQDMYRDPLRFLHVPMDPDHDDVRHVESGGTSLPVHVARAHVDGWIRIAAYLYVYRGEPVDSLLRDQVESAVPQLLSGTRPLTLFLVAGLAPEARVQEIEEPAVDWLVAAWEHYLRVCAP